MKVKWLFAIGVLAFLLYGCFGVINKLPTVSLISPENGAQVAVLASTKAVTLKSTATDPEGRDLTFTVYLGTTQTNLSKIGETSEPEYTVSNLTPGQTYYWKVVVSDGTNSVESPAWSFTVGGNHSLIKVVDFTTGPATVGAKVEILQGNSVVISDLTNQDGHAEFYLPDGRYDIKVTGEGKATSVIYNYDPQIIEAIETHSRRMMTDNDKIPDVEVEILDQSNNVIPDPEATTITFDYIKVHVKSDVIINAAYIGLDYVPGAIARDSRALNTYEFTTGLLDLRRFQDVTIPLHIVVYTPNETRIDKLIYLTINRATVPEVTERYAPTKLWYYGCTSDVDIEYYNLPKPAKEFLSKKMPKEMRQELENYKPEHSIKDSNMLVQLAWSHAPTTNRAGYNVYRSTDAENWEKIAFTTSYYTFDKAVDLVPGQKYYYTVRTVYRDGSESENSNIIEVIPLDLFKVKLISPADNETNVSRTPTFIWKPVDWKDWTSTPHIGGDQIKDQDITFYYYGPWIYDQALSDQHIYCDYYSITNGPQQVSVPFDPYMYPWVRIYPDGSSEDQLEPLEKFKTYEWGLDLAAAYYETEDGFWISTTIDYGYDFDRWDNEADYFNRFTTGE